jgi:hypothetical protein
MGGVIGHRFSWRFVGLLLRRVDSFDHVVSEEGLSGLDESVRPCCLVGSYKRTIVVQIGFAVSYPISVSSTVS